MNKSSDNYFKVLLVFAIFALIFNFHHIFYGTERPAAKPLEHEISGNFWVNIKKIKNEKGDRTEVVAPEKPRSDKHAENEVNNNRKSFDGEKVRNVGTVNNHLFNVQGKFTFDKLSDGEAFPILPKEVPNNYPDRGKDRIWNQMRYVPKDVAEGKSQTKLILLYNGLGGEDYGNRRFITDKCPVSDCFMTGDRSQASKADVILWQHSVYPPLHKRPPNQVWGIYLLESPYHTPSLSYFNGKANWTATYRSDSVIVAPYYKFTPYVPNVFAQKQTKNYAAGKSKKVAWFVSNCGAQNGRLDFARDLGRYIAVDIYGGCGDHHCSRSHANACFDLLNKDYKFYLAFENSNCQNYITEKFFLNGLSHDVLPIVMGARPEDYARVAPLNSYLHVDNFTSAENLAQYLHKLDKNDDLYNQYFAWKGTGLVDTNAFFWCRLCTMAHEAQYTSFTYGDVDSWWRGPGVCTSRAWPGTLRSGSSALTKGPLAH